MRFPSLLWCALASVLAGCAGTSVETIADPAADKEARGIRFYETAPFVLVTSDGKGGLISELIYLPDTTRKRSVRPYAFMANNNSTLTFSNSC